MHCSLKLPFPSNGPEASPLFVAQFWLCAAFLDPSEVIERTQSRQPRIGSVKFIDDSKERTTSRKAGAFAQVRCFILNNSTSSNQHGSLS